MERKRAGRLENVCVRYFRRDEHRVEERERAKEGKEGRREGVKEGRRGERGRNRGGRDGGKERVNYAIQIFECATHP